MKSTHWLLVLVSIGLMALLYFGTSPTSSKMKTAGAKRIHNKSTLDMQQYIHAQTKKLEGKDLDLLDSLMTTDGDNFEALAGQWYRWKNPLISAYYAEQIALAKKTATAWSITGTTLMLAFPQLKEDKMALAYAEQHAVAAFENAISIEPDSIQHQLNLALCYVEQPPQKNPMKGILMLVDLNKKAPENIPVLLNLGKLGVQTGQFEKAKGRYKKILSIDPSQKIVYCALGDIYEKQDSVEQSNYFYDLCRK